ncbi:histone methyltransferase SET1 [Sugiyamaella lignohabitans]|uniref:Histone-lysine N-methyltransferase, H3 lysine-4 specific n=1 Tax=Sugiyamaella lignohabitans TaxID=796027 RepID=A0A161HKP6_9ASCO|nr:histone methyltransferase SET1 [Sugiyamaella lignohabitans]ANB12358.1 histone methyltransferase SET1 [Sugiyamaella lignohabitans]
MNGHSKSSMAVFFPDRVVRDRERDRERDRHGYDRAGSSNRDGINRSHEDRLNGESVSDYDRHGSRSRDIDSRDTRSSRDSRDSGWHHHSSSSRNSASERDYRRDHDLDYRTEYSSSRRGYDEISERERSSDWGRSSDRTRDRDYRSSDRYPSHQSREHGSRHERDGERDRDRDRDRERDRDRDRDRDRERDRERERDRGRDRERDGDRDRERDRDRHRARDKDSSPFSTRSYDSHPDSAHSHHRDYRGRDRDYDRGWDRDNSRTHSRVQSPHGHSNNSHSTRSTSATPSKAVKSSIVSKSTVPSSSISSTSIPSNDSSTKRHSENGSVEVNGKMHEEHKVEKAYSTYLASSSGSSSVSSTTTSIVSSSPATSPDTVISVSPLQGDKPGITSINDTTSTVATERPPPPPKSPPVSNLNGPSRQPPPPPPPSIAGMKGASHSLPPQPATGAPGLTLNSVREHTPQPLPACLIPKEKDPQAVFSKRKEFRIVYDPELSKDKSKGKQPIYKYRSKDESDEKERKPVNDPRKREKYHKYASVGKRSPFNSLPVPRFIYDENWLGKPPATRILVSGLSTLTSKSSVAAEFKIFGEIESCELILNPDTAASLGLCHLRFKGSLDKAHKIAERAISESKKTKIDFRQIKVDFDDNGSKAQEIVDKVIAEQRKKADEAAKQAAKAAAIAAKEAQAAKAKLKLQKPSSRVSTPQPASTASSSTPTAPPALVAGAPLSSFPLIKPAIMKIIDRRPYIMICHEFLPTDDVYPSDIKRVLRNYDWVRVLCDDNGFYIIFENAKEARLCHNEMDGKKLFEFKLAMDLYLEGFAPRVKGASALSSFRSDKGWSKKAAEKKPRDPIKDATERVIKDLRDLLWKDVKERIVAPKIFESLDPSRFGHIKREVAAKPTPNSVAPSFTNGAAADSNEAFSVVERISFNKLPTLPRFKKKTVAVGDDSAKVAMKKFRKDARPMNHRLNFDESDDEKDSEVSTRKPSPIAESITPSVEPEPVPKKKKSKLIKKRDFDFESSGEDDETGNEQTFAVKLLDETIPPPEKKVKVSRKKAVKAIPSPVKKKGRPKKADEEELVDEDTGTKPAEELVAEYEEKTMDQGISDSEINIPHIVDAKSGVDWSPTETPGPLTVCGKEDLTEEVELPEFKSFIKDDEDYGLLQEVLRDTEPDPSIGNAQYWAWKNLQIKKIEYESRQKLDTVSGTPPDMLVGKWDANSNDSRRSIGYYEIPETDKFEYLEHRRKISKPIDTLQRYDRDTSLAGAGGSSRMNRVNNRRLAADITIQKQMLSSETDILNFNQLKKRKKPVKFARSAIHNWGLYAVEPIAANEMIIEYVGEVIRQQLADLRERNYIQSGIGSSYLFRIDETTVVDATKKGGIARVSRLFSSNFSHWNLY